MPYISRDVGLVNSCVDRLAKDDPETHAKVVQSMRAGEEVFVRCSSFTDPGEDYTELVVAGEVVMHTTGY
jgi:hypothetical protein